MKNSTILIAVGPTVALDGLAKRLETIREIPARATVIVVGEMPQFPYSAMGLPPYGAIEIPKEWQDAVKENNAAIKSKAEEIEALLTSHDVSGEVAIVACEPSQVSDAIARRAMLCDLAVISDELRTPETSFQQVVEGVLFQSPVGVLLNDAGTDALPAPKRVFVAWNTQLQAARAVHQALPILREADEVIIGTIDPVMTEPRDGEDPGVDVAKWLTHHGCNVSVQQYPSGGQDIGACILKRAQETGSDLVVMGSYSHSRTRQAVFGGTTRTLLEQTEQAVFLAH